MSAIPKLRPIETKPIQRPHYVQELANVNAFVAANLEALRQWFAQLTAWTDHGMSWEEFCAIQYDLECDRAKQAELARDDDRYGEDFVDEMYGSSYDAETGIAKQGPL